MSPLDLPPQRREHAEYLAMTEKWEAVAGESQKKRVVSRQPTSQTFPRLAYLMLPRPVLSIVLLL